MFISVSKIKQQPGLSQSYDLSLVIPPDAAADFPDFTLSGEVKTFGTVTNKGDGVYLLEGTYEANIIYDCSRCLSKCTEKVSGSISSLYCENTAAVDEDETDVRPLKAGEIDPAELIMSSISMNMPMQPLCREDCRGLCPICGADLNKQACSCEKDIIDPRWEKLKDFKFTSDK